jgi:hypothetical protein
MLFLRCGFIYLYIRCSKSYRIHLCAEGEIKSRNAFAADIGSVIDAFLIESARIRFTQIHLHI